MKYEQFEKEIMQEVESDIHNNNEFYKLGETDISKYNIDLMKDVTSWNDRLVIASDDSFNHLCRIIDEAKQTLQKHQVARFLEPSLDVESGGEYVTFDYSLCIYEPIKEFSEIQSYYQESVLKSMMAKKLGLHNKRYLKCEVMKLYKDGIITMEQLKEAHSGSC